MGYRAIYSWRHSSVRPHSWLRAWMEINVYRVLIVLQRVNIGT